MAITFRQSRALTLMSYTSLIDVVLLLLIFFMVASRFAEEEREMEVTLPRASDAKPLTVRPKEIFVNVDALGRYFVGGKELSIDEVDRYLAQASADNPVGQGVIIRADKRVALDAAVAVMNACNKHGLTDYSLTTEHE